MTRKKQQEKTARKNSKKKQQEKKIIKVEIILLIFIHNKCLIFSFNYFTLNFQSLFFIVAKIIFWFHFYKVFLGNYFFKNFFDFVRFMKPINISAFVKLFYLFINSKFLKLKTEN